jgi:DNA-directed RNA polymerase subunit RPC12/RpoP
MEICKECKKQLSKLNFDTDTRLITYECDYCGYVEKGIPVDEFVE